MSDFCICSLAIGPKRYIKSIPVMKQFLIKQGYKGEFLTYVNCLPKNCPPHPRPGGGYDEERGEVPYAFKYYLFKEAQALGYRYIGWLDSVLGLQKPFSTIEKVLKEHGYFFALNGDDLEKWTSDNCLEYFGMERGEIVNKSTIMGGIIFLDLKIEKCRIFLDEMFKMSYIGGPFCGDWHNNNYQVSKDSCVRGHRHDQSTASVLIQKLDMTNLVNRVLGYAGDKSEYIFRFIGGRDLK